MVNKFVLALAVVVCSVAAINAACLNPCYPDVHHCALPYCGTGPCNGLGLGHCNSNGLGHCYGNGLGCGGCGNCGGCGSCGNCGSCGGLGSCGGCGSCGKTNYKSPQKNLHVGNSNNKNPAVASSTNAVENNVSVKQNQKNANKGVNRNQNRNLQKQKANQAQLNKNKNVNGCGKKNCNVCPRVC